MINAGTREKDISWVRENTKEMDCVVEDYSDAYTQLAIQGPRAVDVVKKLTDVHLDGIKNYWFTHGTICELPCRLIARTGYTGEDGFEIYVPSDVETSETVWNTVIEAGKFYEAETSATIVRRRSCGRSMEWETASGIFSAFSICDDFTSVAIAIP